MEQLVLKVLNFEVAVATPLLFLNYFLDEQEQNDDDRVKFLAWVR